MKRSLTFRGGLCLFAFVLVISSCNQSDETLLDLAQSGKASSVRAAIKRGSDVNEKNEKGETPLMLAARWNPDSFPVMKLLIAAGADVNAKDRYDTTILMAALLSYRRTTTLDIVKAIVKALIAAGADVNAKDKDGKTALLLAAELTTPHDIMQILVNAGADLDIKGEGGVNALMTLVQNRADAWSIKMLLDAGCDVNAKDDKGRTPSCTLSKIKKEKSSLIIQAYVL